MIDLDGSAPAANTRILDHSSLPTSPARRSRRSPIWLGMLVLYLVWGSTYLGIAIAVETIPPFLMASVREVAAGLILLAWSVAREGRAFLVWRRCIGPKCLMTLTHPTAVTGAR